MAEKMYSFTHLISETKLLAMISQHAEEVRIDILQAPAKRGRQPRQQNLEGAAPLMLEAPKHQAAGANGHKKPRTGKSGKKTGTTIALEYLVANKDRIVTGKELAANAVKHRHSPHAMSVNLTTFIKKGYVERVGTGQYQILKKGIAALGGEASASPTNTEKKKRNAVQNGGLGRLGKGTAMIWAELVKGEQVTAESLREMYTNAGLSPNSVANAAHSFVERGVATRIENGVFQINKKGIDIHAKQTAAA